MARPGKRVIDQVIRGRGFILMPGSTPRFWQAFEEEWFPGERKWLLVNERDQEWTLIASPSDTSVWKR